MIITGTWMFNIKVVLFQLHETYQLYFPYQIYETCDI